MLAACQDAPEHLMDDTILSQLATFQACRSEWIRTTLTNLQTSTKTRTLVLRIWENLVLPQTYFQPFEMFRPGQHNACSYGLNGRSHGFTAASDGFF